MPRKKRDLGHRNRPHSDCMYYIYVCSCILEHPYMCNVPVLCVCVCMSACVYVCIWRSIARCVPITVVHFSHTGEQLWVRLRPSTPFCLRDRCLPLPCRIVVADSNHTRAAFPVIYYSLQKYWSPGRIILQVNVCVGGGEGERRGEGEEEED